MPSRRPFAGRRLVAQHLPGGGVAPQRRRLGVPGLPSVRTGLTGRALIETVPAESVSQRVRTAGPVRDGLALGLALQHRQEVGGEASLILSHTPP